MNKKLYRYFIETRTHRNLRRDFPQELAAEFSASGLSPEERMTRRFELLCQAEKPQMQPFEKIVLMRTVKKQPDIFTEAEWRTSEQNTTSMSWALFPTSRLITVGSSVRVCSPCGRTRTHTAGA